MQLIHLHSEDHSGLADWIQQKTDKYTSGEMQNEMIKVMALRVLQDIAEQLQKSLFSTIIVDEMTDVSNVEQVVICLRWVNENFEVQEEFVGLFKVASTGAENIYAAITDLFLCLNLPMSKVHGFQHIWKNSLRQLKVIKNNYSRYHKPFSKFHPLSMCHPLSM